MLLFTCPTGSRSVHRGSMRSTVVMGFSFGSRPMGSRSRCRTRASVAVSEQRSICETWRLAVGGHPRGKRDLAVVADGLRIPDCSVTAHPQGRAYVAGIIAGEERTQEVHSHRGG